MTNISLIILGHNKNLLNPTVLNPIIFKTDVHFEANKGYKFYFGVAQTPFEERFRNHNWNFNHKQYIESSELPKYIWSLKDVGTPYTINWLIVAKVR